MVTGDRKTELAAGLVATKSRIAAAAKSVNRDPKDISLIVVTKTFPRTDVDFLYELGVRDFGENRDQEGSVKSENSPSDAMWHFQGQIQSNKIKSILSWAAVVHSLANLDHAIRLNDQFLKITDELGSKKYPVLIQISLDPEVRVERNGMAPSGLPRFVDEIAKFEGLELKGLMAVAPLSEGPDLAFARMAAVFNEFQRNNPEANWLSAGMSGDFESAIQYGATHVRVGSSILGNRSNP